MSIGTNDIGGLLFHFGNGGPCAVPSADKDTARGSAVANGPAYLQLLSPVVPLSTLITRQYCPVALSCASLNTLLPSLPPAAARAAPSAVVPAGPPSMRGGLVTAPQQRAPPGVRRPRAGPGGGANAAEGVGVVGEVRRLAARALEVTTALGAFALLLYIHPTWHRGDTDKSTHTGY